MSANNQAVIANYLYQAQLRKAKMQSIVGQDLILQSDFAAARFRCANSEVNLKLAELALAKVSHSNAKTNYYLVVAQSLQAKAKRLAEDKLTPRQQRADKALAIVAAIAFGLITINFVEGLVKTQPVPARIERTGYYI